MQLFSHMDLTVDPLTAVPTSHSGDNSNPYQLPYKTVYWWQNKIKFYKFYSSKPTSHSEPAQRLLPSWKGEIPTVLLWKPVKTIAFKRKMLDRNDKQLHRYLPCLSLESIDFSASTDALFPTNSLFARSFL